MIIELWLIYFFFSALILGVGWKMRTAPLITLAFVLFMGLGYLTLTNGIGLPVGTTTSIADVNSYYSVETENIDYNYFTSTNNIGVNVLSFLLVWLSAFGIMASLMLYAQNSRH